MGIGMALSEELPDSMGIPRVHVYDKYHLVNAPDMPDPEIILIETMNPGVLSGEEHRRNFHSSYRPQ